jgi:hypothetical protein
VPELFAQIKPFFDHLLCEHRLLLGDPGWQAELVLEDLLDSSHQNVAQAKYIIVQPTSCFKSIPLNKKACPDHHVGSHLPLSVGPLLGWWQWGGRLQCLQDSNMQRSPPFSLLPVTMPLQRHVDTILILFEGYRGKQLCHTGRLYG